MKAVALVVVLLGLSCGTVNSQTCSSTTCASGCCDATGQCTAGTSQDACGSAGRACAACPTGTACGLGTCVVSASGGGSGGGSATGGGSGSGGGSSGAGTCARPTPLTLVDFGSPGKLRAIAQGTTVGATDSEGIVLSSCGGTGAPDQTYEVAVPSGVILSAKAIRSGTWRPIIKVRSRVCTEPDDRCAAASVGAATASVELTVTTASTYRVTVDGADGTSGGFELQLETRPPADGGP